MNAFVRRLSIGVASVALTIGTAGVSSAKPFPWPPHRHHHHPQGPVLVTPMVYRPTVYLPVNPVNPVPASIRLVNPLQNQVALRYRLNGGSVQVLPAGSSMDIYQASVIEFDRGGAVGRARYSLTTGAYRFVSVNGYWTLVQETAE